MRAFLAALLLLSASLLSPVNAQMLDTVVATTPERAMQLRTQMIQAIWESNRWSTPELLTSASTEDLSALVGITTESQTWLEWHWSTGSPLGMFVRTLYVTFPGSTCLMIFHGGHGEGFVTGGYTSGIAALLSALATANCDLILISMVGDGDNYQYRQHASLDPNPATSIHDQLGVDLTVAPPVGSPLRYFLEPVIGSLDYALAHRTYSKVGLSGLSGGAWTTTLIAAIDPRIQRSYAVAGSIPMSFHSGAPDAGDWEQQLPGIWPGIDYPDLYLMAVAEPTRRAMLLHNDVDSCCFQASRVEPYAGELQWYASQTGFGALSWFFQRDVAGHDIFPDARAAIMADFTGP